MSIKNKLDELTNLVNHFEERKARAKERLSIETNSYWCFALVGFNTDIEEFKAEDFATIRRVIEPPGEVELATAIKDRYLY